MGLDEVKELVDELWEAVQELEDVPDIGCECWRVEGKLVRVGNSLCLRIPREISGRLPERFTVLFDCGFCRLLVDRKKVRSGKRFVFSVPKLLLEACCLDEGDTLRAYVFERVLSREERLKIISHYRDLVSRILYTVREIRDALRWLE